MKIGEMIDKMFELREKKRELNEQIKTINEAIETLEQTVISQMELEGIIKATGAKATAAIKADIYPSVVDKEVFAEWLVENKRFELLPARVNAAPVREMLKKENITPPGVEVFTKTRLNLRRL